MSSVSLALAALQTALADIDPAPQPVPENIYLWPDDYSSMDYTTFPFIIVAQVVNRWFDFEDVIQPSVVDHKWIAEINICLAEGPLNRMEAAQTAEAKQVPWIVALATILSANRGMGATSLAIGSDERLFRYRVGHIGWDKQQVFWGIRAEVEVIQEHSLPAI